MHSEQKVTTENLEEVLDRIHENCMLRMGLRRGSASERTFLALALAGEAGEVANVQKKIWRDGPSPELYTKLLDEIADVYAYLDHLCKALNTTREDVLVHKLNEVVTRPYAQEIALSGA